MSSALYVTSAGGNLILQEHLLSSSSEQCTGSLLSFSSPTVVKLEIPDLVDWQKGS